MQNGGTHNIHMRYVTVLSVNLIIVDIVELETLTWYLQITQTCNLRFCDSVK